MRKANQITPEELGTLVFLVNDGMPYDKVAKYFTINRGLKMSGTTVRNFYLNAIKQGKKVSALNNIHKLKSKHYFSHYGELCSLTHEDAIALAKKALEGNGYKLDEFASFRRIKIGSSIGPRTNTLMYGGKRIDINHCLDWKDFEWKEFLNRLEETTI